ncbi:hypothetical protein JKG47_08990 [Acidithiobacillus sp. MC6.1]|nr:hypothetical protein [Acidithiobacillus sp. MC6.1]
MYIDNRFAASMPAREHQTEQWALREGRNALEFAQSVKRPDRPIALIGNRARIVGFFAALTGEPVDEAGKILAENNGEFPDMEDATTKATYWGRGQRAHNKFTGHELIMLDSPSMPREAQQEAWLKHRAALIMIGVDPDSLPVGSFTDGDYIAGHKTKVGNYEHTHLARMHRDPQIREFLQSILDNEEIQWIGRARALNASPDDPIRVYKIGGVPNASYEKYGITHDQIHEAKLLQRQSRRERLDEIVRKKNQKVWTASQILHDSGREITHKTINEMLEQIGEDPVHKRVMQRVTAQPEWAQRFADDAAKIGRGARAMKAIAGAKKTAETVNDPQAVEKAAKRVIEALHSKGGNTRALIEWAHSIMRPGADNLHSNMAGWLAINTYADTPAERYPAAMFPSGPPA